MCAVWRRREARRRRKEVITRRPIKIFHDFPKPTLEKKIATWFECIHGLGITTSQQNVAFIAGICIYSLITLVGLNRNEAATSPCGFTTAKLAETVFLFFFLSHAVAPHLGQRIIIPIKAHHILHLSLHFTALCIEIEYISLHASDCVRSAIRLEPCVRCLTFFFIFHEERTWTVNLLEQWSKIYGILRMRR